MEKIIVSTSKRSEFIDITGEIQNIVSKQKIASGICHIHFPHTTAGITINENADPDVVKDMLKSLEKLVPWDANYSHAEGNSAAHIKASMMGFSTVVFIENGSLQLGTWQGIYFTEFDGPRRREVWVKIT